MAVAQAEVLRRKRFTREEVDQMLDMGLFAGERYELIDGELIDKMGQKPPHSTAIQKVARLLAGIFHLDQVRTQFPIEVAGQDRKWSEPEPDVTVTAKKSTAYERRHPRGDELLLLVEVADSSVAQDSTTKRDLYARAGVKEYWVLDLRKRRLTVHRRPVHGKYPQTTSHGDDEEVSIEAKPDSRLRVADMLP